MEGNRIVPSSLLIGANWVAPVDEKGKRENKYATVPGGKREDILVTTACPGGRR